MIVLKSRYNKLFELFIKEKHGALELYNENKKLKSQIYELEAERADLRFQLLRLKGVL